MAYTTPFTAVVGNPIKASDWNTYGRDNILACAAAAMVSAGDLVQGTGANALARLAAGATAGMYLRSSGSSAALAWQVIGQGELAQVRRVWVYRASNQTISDSTATGVSFTSETSKTTTGMHSNSTNPERLIATEAGVVHLNCIVYWTGNATGTRTLQIRKNGTAILATNIRNNLGAGNFSQQVQVHDLAAVNDYYEVIVTQSSGGNLDVIGTAHQTLFEMTLHAGSSA